LSERGLFGNDEVAISERFGVAPILLVVLYGVKPEK
jgi:hypothetical protein